MSSLSTPIQGLGWVAPGKYIPNRSELVCVWKKLTGKKVKINKDWVNNIQVGRYSTGLNKPMTDRYLQMFLIPGKMADRKCQRHTLRRSYVTVCNIYVIWSS